MSNNPGQVFTPVTNQTITTGAVSAALTNPFGTYTTIVRLCATAACHVKLGATPTATASDMYLPANTVMYIEVAPGQKVAAIQNAAAGVLHVTEMV